MYRARNLATTWHRACFLQPVRTYASRKGGGSESKFRRKVQRTEEEVRHLERKFDSSTKSKQHKHSSPLPPTSIASIYASISDIQTPSPAPRSKINPLFLENLKLKFLDTRGADAGEDIGALTEITADQLRIAKVGRWTLGEPEFNQLLNTISRPPSAPTTTSSTLTPMPVTPTAPSRPSSASEPVHSSTHTHMHALSRSSYPSLHSSPFPFPAIEAFTPDVYTFSTLIKAFVSHSRLDDAFIVFDRMREGGVVPSQPVFATLISGCLRAGELNRAWDTFDDMRLKYHCPDEVTYTLMIGACAKVGRWV
ncbi:hypothetical protein BC936DRAFT_139030 [Jimgerdemannia flammicorona]|uniref:Pentacotripeptide-repeat region of PRORP domain-containing protein n=1 Tax=Jimgerdemannia flammicorona TaxID=994334 RepID=A0A433DI47_9FUNG|nr:hypothetical protein BC936DRAFT_139030 [Jimgerdemannia flammicorona]